MVSEDIVNNFEELHIQVCHYNAPGNVEVPGLTVLHL